ncbi:MAG TPA: hypothetical protein DCZ92_04745 [Elusimicrobia bacterium]|nr:MAG: hypothetical protein A2016_03615 [Elusimicrobia bacterium GWF2_62_30]HBA60116.1 hypothetical protein [Elusimicrobiota bacterium]
MTKHLLAAAILFTLAAEAGAQSRTQDLRTKPPEYWSSGKYALDATLSGAYLKGNVDNTAIAGGINYTARPWEKNQFSIESNAGYTSFNGHILLDNLKGSALYAYAVKDNLNLFAVTTHAKNRSLKLDYRSSTGLGLCVHGFLPDVFNPILLSLAVTPEHEVHSDDSKENATRGMLRLNFKAPLTDYLSLGSDFVYTPDLAAFSDYRFYGETFLQFKISPEKLFFRVTFSDEYDAVPRPGVRKNDFAINYAIGVHLGK